MPDRYGFDHLPWWGVVTHRCIEEGCAYEGTPLPEHARARHARKHANQVKHAQDKERLRNLAKARKAKEAYNEGEV